MLNAGSQADAGERNDRAHEVELEFPPPPPCGTPNFNASGTQPSLWPMVASCRCKILGQITKTCLRYFPVSLTRERALSAALCAGFYSLRSLSDIRQSDFKHAAIACSGVSAEAPAHSDETASSHGASVSEISGKVWWALRG